MVMIQAFHLVMCIFCKLLIFLLCYCVLAISVHFIFGCCVSKIVGFVEFLFIFSWILVLVLCSRCLPYFWNLMKVNCIEQFHCVRQGLPCFHTPRILLKSCAYLWFLQSGIRNLNAKSTFQKYIFANIFDQFQQLHCICANTLHKKQVLTFSSWVSRATWKTFKAFFCHGKFVLL